MSTRRIERVKHTLIVKSSTLWRINATVAEDRERLRHKLLAYAYSVFGEDFNVFPDIYESTTIGAEIPYISPEEARILRQG